MPTLEREIGSLEAAMGDPDFWNNQEKARAANTRIASLKKKLGAFQKLNDIPVSGKLDNPTLNRLLHLDYDAKNLKRAKPFREDLLPVGFDPTKP